MIVLPFQNYVQGDLIVFEQPSFEPLSALNKNDYTEDRPFSEIRAVQWLQ